MNQPQTLAVELISEIENQRKKLNTTSLDISFNELLDMTKSQELNIQPEYQRMFQWSEGARSRFIESLLLEMPVPPIYVVEEEENKYLLIDGLQRISSYLHFRGELNAPHLGIEHGNKLKLVDCDIVPAFNGLTYDDLPTALQIRLKRNFVRVEVVRHGSDPRYKYYMFKRLNTGGVTLSEQQMRNCTIRLLSPTFNDFIIDQSENEDFQSCTANLSDEQALNWYDKELILRFFALKNWRTNFTHEVSDFLTEFMEGVSDPAMNIPFDYDNERECFKKTFKILNLSLGEDSFARPNKAGNGFVAGFGIYHFESITIGLQAVIDRIDPTDDESVRRVEAALRGIKLDGEFIGLTKGGG
jgi:hypothetical protein